MLWTPHSCGSLDTQNTSRCSLKLNLQTLSPGGPPAPPALWGHRQSNVIRGWAERLGQEAGALSYPLFLCEMGQESGFWVTDPSRLLAGKHVHPGLPSRVLSSVLEILLILQASRLERALSACVLLLKLSFFPQGRKSCCGLISPCDKTFSLTSQL